MSVGSFSIEAAEVEAVEKVVGMGLWVHDKESGIPAWQMIPYGLSVSDQEGRPFGGLIAEIVWDWMQIKLMWVDESQRKSGVGSALLAKAEADAKAKGLTGLYTWTHDWQAPAFYEKCGFERFVVLPDFPKGHHCVGLSKRLEVAA
jgi:ribosomal protein S18 acetylase RimI-like enzyme